MYGGEAEKTWPGCIRTGDGHAGGRVATTMREASRCDARGSIRLGITFIDLNVSRGNETATMPRTLPEIHKDGSSTCSPPRPFSSTPQRRSLVLYCLSILYTVSLYTNCLEP